MTIKIGICDDDIAITGRIETMLEGIVGKTLIQTEMEVFWDGKKLVDTIDGGTYFDIVFLDIEMGQENGITIAKKIREIDKNVLIVYVTSHEIYMEESFEVRPFRFMVKPVSEGKLADCLRAAYEEISNNDSYFRYSYQRVSHKIPIRDICYFESERRKIYIVTAKEKLEFYGKLNEIERTVENSKATFLRVHQSFLINYRHVDGIGHDFVVMDNGQRLPISHDRQKKISQEYSAMEDTFYVVD